MKPETTELIKLIASIISIIAPALFGIFFYRIRDSVTKVLDQKFDAFKKETFDHIDTKVQLKIQEHMLSDQSSELNSFREILAMHNSEKEELRSFKKYVYAKIGERRED